MLVLTSAPPPPLDCNKQIKKWSAMAAGKGCGDGKDGFVVVVMVAAKLLAVAVFTTSGGGGGSYSGSRMQ
jgi:hypothetical protein